jgi:hypothetical protein
MDNKTLYLLAELEKTPDVQARAWEAAKQLRRLAAMNDELLQVLIDVVRVSDRATVEYQTAHATIAKAKEGRT